MEHEVGDLLKLGIAMITISTVIFLVIGSVIYGRQIGYQYLDKGEELHLELENGDLNYLSDQLVEVPTATVLALFKANDGYVNAVYLNYKNLLGSDYSDAYSSGADENKHRLYDIETGKKTDLYKAFEKHVSAKCKLYIEYNQNAGGYDFYIHDLRCRNSSPNHKGVCN